MNPTDQQLNARLNPTPTQFSTPSTQGLFRGVGDYGTTLYRRAGNRIEAVNLVDAFVPQVDRQNIGNSGEQAKRALDTLRTQYGVDWSSLPQINIGDLQSTGYNQGLQVFRRAGAEGGPDNFINPFTGDITSFLGAKQAVSVGSLPVNTQQNTLASRQDIERSGIIPNSVGTNPNLVTSNASSNLNIKSPYTGPSIVDYLSSAGVPSDFSNRAKLAQQAGIQNYQGTAEQNTQLLNILRSGAQNVTEPQIQTAPLVLDASRPISSDEIATSGTLGELLNERSQIENTLLNSLRREQQARNALNELSIRGLQQQIGVESQAIPQPLIGQQLQNLQRQIAFEQLPLQNELESAQTAQQIALKIQELSKPNTDVTYQTDNNGNTTAIVYDKNTGQITTQNIGKIGVSKTTSGGGSTTQPILSSGGLPLEYGSPEYVENALDRSASYTKFPVAGERENLAKFQRVIAQVSALSTSLNDTLTDPIIGRLKQFNPYNFDARAVNAQINALVPNVARGVYGEVGVLTDSDVERYLLTLPNIKSTKQQNDFVTALTLTNARRAFEIDLLNLASSGINVSGYKETYRNLTKQIESIENKLGIKKETPVLSDLGISPAEEALFDEISSTPQTTSGGFFSNVLKGFTNLFK